MNTNKTPWAKARSEHKGLDELLSRRAAFASLDRRLTIKENEELKLINESIGLWQNTLNLN